MNRSWSECQLLDSIMRPFTQCRNYEKVSKQNTYTCGGNTCVFVTQVLQIHVLLWSQWTLVLNHAEVIDIHDSSVCDSVKNTCFHDSDSSHVT